MATFTRDWDEATPTNATEAHLGDDYIRYRTIDVAERLKAMFYGFTNGENTYEASVKNLNLKNQSTPATPSSGYGRLYSKEVNSQSELHFLDDDGDEVQVTVNGKLNWAALTVAANAIDQTHIELANNSRYGLAASVWTENVNLALDIAPKLKAGTVWVNCSNVFDAASGFGG